MTNNFYSLPENLADPSSVRNFLKDAQNNAQRKSYGIVFHVLFAILCAVAVYFDTSLGGQSVILLCLAPSMCVFTFLYSPMYLKAVPLVLPLVAVSIKFIVDNTGFLAASSQLFIYLLCILTAAIITKAVISGYSKGTLFVMLCIVYGIISFCQIMFAFITEYGTFSFSMLLDTINNGFEFLVNSVENFAKTSEGLEALKSMSVPGTTLSDEEIIKLAKDSVKITSQTILTIIPALYIWSCMIYSFVTVAVFSLFARFFKINVFVCIMDKNWTYRPSMVSAIMYDIVFFAFIIGMFTNLPENISAAILNLLLVLTPSMFLAGIRGIYTPIFKKSQNTFLSVLITAAIAIAATALTGGLALLIISSFGVTFITNRNRQERMIVPVKYASDLALYHSMSAPEQVSDNISSDSENNPENQ